MGRPAKTGGKLTWRALVVSGGLKAGDTVLTLGTGGVSVFALQFAKMMSARVIADAFRHEESGRHFGKICLEF